VRVYVSSSVRLKEFVMKACFAAVIACVSFVAVAHAGEEPKSVLVQTPAAAPVVVAEPAVVCTTGCCTKLYNAETRVEESCRNRLFGGHVVRKSSRTVYKPVRR
jgi:hypothetical protein